MRRRLARFTTVGATLLISAVVTAGPAVALKSDDGEVHGPSLGIGMTILYYVVIPVGAFLVIGGLALLPSALAKPRYRPGAPWDYDPVWFSGPDDPTQALAEVAASTTAKGGASAEW